MNEDLCESCEKNEAVKPHTCPYAEDIHNDHLSLCNCCSDCEEKCALDV